MAKPSTEKNKEEVAARVERLAAVGMTQEDAGYILGMARDSIQRHYAEAWNKGKAKAKAAVASKLYEKAMAGDNASIFFWLKTQAHWRETQHIDHSSSDGSMSGPLKVTVEYIAPPKREEE